MTAAQTLAARYPSLPYVVPFATFLLFLSLDGKLNLQPEAEYPLRVGILGCVLWVFSRDVVDLRVRRAASSVALGIAVFAIWIAPDLLFPGWRQHWLFQNALVGSAPTPEGGYGSQSAVALVFRTIRAVALVPIVEELFWRAWLMRYLVKPAFETLPLGTFELRSFLITAVLFAAEHGPYWDVGLLAGLLYNWWMVRTRSLGSCILAHAVTNAVLSAYVIRTGNWQYW